MSQKAYSSAVRCASVEMRQTPRFSPPSYTPKTVVVVKGAKKRTAEANYRVSPEDSKLTGSGGSAK